MARKDEEPKNPPGQEKVNQLIKNYRLTRGQKIWPGTFNRSPQAQDAKRTLSADLENKLKSGEITTADIAAAFSLELDYADMYSSLDSLNGHPDD